MAKAKEWIVLIKLTNKTVLAHLTASNEKVAMNRAKENNLTLSELRLVKEIRIISVEEMRNRYDWDS